jgi:hypothetical protein
MGVLRSVLQSPLPRLALAAALLGGCSTSNATGTDDAGASEDATTCNPLPETQSTGTDDDCVAIVPNPCCDQFFGFNCAPDGDAGGQMCSETDTCVRAARYDTTLCNGGSAYSCPIVYGQVSATLISPPCVQMETVGPTGEGIRWCCGGNVTAPSLDAGIHAGLDAGLDASVGQPSGTDSGGASPGGDAGVSDAALD